MQAKLNREFVHYCPLAGRYPGTARKAGLIMHNNLLGRQIPSLLTCLHSPFFTLAFIVKHDTIWYRLSLWSVGVSYPGSVLS